MTKTLRHPAIPPMHPGELLAEIIIPATRMDKAAIAERLGVSRQTLYNILRQRHGVTPALALRLGKLFDNGAEFWLNLQRDFDLWHGEKRLRQELKSIRPVKAA
jgi:addiction module HigA family antidote